MYNPKSSHYPSPRATDSKLNLESADTTSCETKLPSLRELLVRIDESFQQERNRSLGGSVSPTPIPLASPRQASMSMGSLVHPPSYKPTEWALQHPLYKEFNSHFPQSQEPSLVKNTLDHGHSDSDSVAESRSDLSSTYSVSSTDSKKSSKEPPRRYLCTICDKRFTRPSTLKTHLNGHTGQKPFACPNKGCAWRFTVLSNMKRHAKICVAGEVHLPSAEK